jgi:hypothetical protein
MKRNFKTSLLVLTIILFLVTVYAVAHTFAVFQSDAESEVEVRLAKWNIKVNNELVTATANHTFTIDGDYLSVVSTNKVVEKKIAPGAEGNFDIEIFPDGTQVSLRFDIFVDASAVEGTEITVNDVVSLTDDVTIIRTDENVYTGIMSLEDIQAGKTAHLRVTFEWVNSDEPNAIKSDTNLALSDEATIRIPVSVDFIQYKGETIEEYVPSP